MHPDLRRYYDHVYPVFWPWLWWNLVRVALWHIRTGREALLMVDCFGNIRFAFVSDAPKPDGLYTYEAPKVPRWECPALAVQPLLPGEKGLGMRGEGVAASAAFATTPRPLTPAPLPRERGLPAPAPPQAKICPQTPAQAGVHGPVFPIAYAEMTAPWMPAFAGIGGK